MKIVKDKFVLMSPIIVLAVVILFSLTMVPSVNPTSKTYRLLLLMRMKV